MTTDIEKDSPAVPLIIAGVLLLILAGGGLGLAYIGGVFTGKDAVIENDKRISHGAATTQPHP